MEWLAAVGGIAGSVGGIADSFNGTNKTKADAQLVQAKAQQDAVNAQREANLLAAKNQQQMMQYGLIAVAVVAASVLVYRAVA